MQNSEKTYALPPEFNVNSTEFNTTTSVNSNWEMDDVPRHNDLNVNAAAASNNIPNMIILNDPDHKD